MVCYLLANAGITCKHVGILNDGETRGGVVRDLQHTTPLGEVSAVLLVLGTTLRQAIQTWGGGGEGGSTDILYEPHKSLQLLNIADLNTSHKL